MLCLEKALDESLDRLKARLHELRPESDLSEAADDDDVESIASSTVHPHAQYTIDGRFVRFTGPTSVSSATIREIESLRSKLSHAEDDNQDLRREVQELRDMLSKAGVPPEDYEKRDVTNGGVDKNATNRDDDDEDGQKVNLISVPSSIHSEGGVFNLVRNKYSN
mmetsp:Transcript_44754/g.108526  ORF Transcript_44754/g.108526 Transcript_44754/m.108526 type:complete len:165 (-) Transcript_44754:96-590(-)